MPDLFGKLRDTAVSELNKNNLELGSISEVESEYAAGTIIWQNISAGEKVTERTVIYLKISKGPKETPVQQETPTPETEAPPVETNGGGEVT